MERVQRADALTDGHAAVTPPPQPLTPPTAASTLLHVTDAPPTTSSPLRIGLLTAARAQHPVLEVSLLCDPPLADHPQPAVQHFAARYAPSVFLDVGTACPLHCVYCSVVRGADDKDVRMEAREHLYMRMADAESVGVRKLTFIGGEAASRTDFMHLADVAHAMGFQDLILATKSVKLARPVFVAQLREHHVSMVHLSLDSFDPDVLAVLLASRTAPKLLLAGLHELLAQQMELFLFAVLTQHNLAGLDDYVRRLADLQQRYGRPMTAVVSPLKVQSRADKNRETLVPRMADLARAVARAVDLAQTLDVTLIHKAVPPCLLPQHGDWALERYLTEARLDLQNGQRLPSAANPYLAKSAACASCAATAVCPGVDAAYADWQGWAEFSPLT